MGSLAARGGEMVRYGKWRQLAYNADAQGALACPGRSRRKRSKTLTVDEKDVREARLRQGGGHVSHHRDERRRPQGHRPGEGPVMVGHAVVYGGGEEGAGGDRNAAGHCLSDMGRRHMRGEWHSGVRFRPK